MFVSRPGRSVSHDGPPHVREQATHQNEQQVRVDDQRGHQLERYDRHPGHGGRDQLDQVHRLHRQPFLGEDNFEVCHWDIHKRLDVDCAIDRRGCTVFPVWQQTINHHQFAERGFLQLSSLEERPQVDIFRLQRQPFDLTARMDRIAVATVICLYVFGGNNRLGFLVLLTPQQVTDLLKDPEQRFRDDHVEFLEEEKPLVLVDTDTSAKQQRMLSKFRRFTDAIEVRPVLEEDVGQAAVKTPPIDFDGQAEQIVLGVGDIDGLLIQGNEVRLLECFDEILQETTL